MVAFEFIQGRPAPIYGFYDTENGRPSFRHTDHPHTLEVLFSAGQANFMAQRIAELTEENRQLKINAKRDEEELRDRQIQINSFQCIQQNLEAGNRGLQAVISEQSRANRKLFDRIRFLETCSLIEAMLSNPNVNEGIADREQQISRLQAERDKAKELLGELVAAIELDVRRAKEVFHNIEQILGKALHFPAYKDDQANFPGATEADGVCTGEHTAESIAESAAAMIKALEFDLQNANRLLWEREYCGGFDYGRFWS